MEMYGVMFTQGAALGYVIIGLSARIVYKQAPLANIEIKHWTPKQYKGE